MARFILIFILALFSSQVIGQLNVKVSYNLAYYLSSENNEILNEFNSVKEDEFTGGLTRSFSPLRLMNGIGLGLRHKLSDMHSFEIGWENLSAKKEAMAETNNASLFKQKLFYSSNQFYLDYQTRFSNFGFGLGFGRSILKVKDEIGNSEIKKEVLSQARWIVRTSLAFYFSGSTNVSFSIQPYLNLSLDDVGLDPLKQELSLNELSGQSSPFSNFGIRFIFYNGVQ